MDVTFCRTRHEYDSYTDYWRLVELSGFPIVWVDQMELEDRTKTYIVSPMNGEFLHHINWERDKQCTIIHWNLERPGEHGLNGYIKGNREYIEAGMVDTVVVSDRQLAQDTGFHYVPLGIHEGLGTPGNGIKVYDFIHLMCYSYKRSQTGLFNYITPREHWRGFNIAPNGWGEARRNALQSSRFMLNVHQDEWFYMEPLRFVLAAAYGLPILSEKLEDPYPYMRVRQFDLVNMEEAMHEALVNQEQAAEAALYMRERMLTDFTFRHSLESFL